MRPETSDLIAAFRRDPTSLLAEINAERGLTRSAFVRDRALEEAASRAPSDACRALDALAARQDEVNLALRAAHTDVAGARHGVSVYWTPINRVGVYVPSRLASTAVTYLSAMAAAGIPEPLVYLAQDARGEPDPLCAYAARRYRAATLVGPARLGFLALAFGVPAEGVTPVDLLAGPCGRALNELKHLACLAGSAVPDMFAGPSAVAIIADESAPWDRVELDLAAQLEHGADSAATLVVIGDSGLAAWRARPELNARVEVVKVHDVDEAVKYVDALAPETLEVWTRDAGAVARAIRCAGVVYVRTSSSLGDYGAIGRGCADPTNRRARAQSGLLPGTFLRAVPVVSVDPKAASLGQAAALIARCEGLPAHAASILAAS